MQQVNVFIETSSRFRGNVERKFLLSLRDAAVHR